MFGFADLTVQFLTERAERARRNGAEQMRWDCEMAIWFTERGSCPTGLDADAVQRCMQRIVDDQRECDASAAFDAAEQADRCDDE